MEPTRHKALYVDDCLHQIAELNTDVQRYKVGLCQHMDTMEKEIRDHLWVTDDFVEPASTSLTETAAQVETLLARVDKLKRGFELLPRERGPEPAKKQAKK